jgi:hypothetical protein
MPDCAKCGDHVGFLDWFENQGFCDGCGAEIQDEIDEASAEDEDFDFFDDHED